MTSSNSKGRKAARAPRPDIKARKPARRRPAPKAPPRRPAAKLPDLQANLAALFDAIALVSVAQSALAASNHGDLEETVLRLAVDALEAIYDQLDAAAVQLARFRTKHAGTVGGAS